MTSEVFFYSIIHKNCSCRQKNGDLRNIGKLYKEYYRRLNAGEKSVDILSNISDKDGETSLPRMCCRSRFLSIPIVPMIDRTKEVIYDDRKEDIITKDSEKLYPGYEPLEFPAIDGAKSLKVIPPTVKVEGTLPGGF